MITAKEIALEIWDAKMCRDEDTVRGREYDLLKLIQNFVLDGDFKAAFEAAKYAHDVDVMDIKLK